MNKKPWLAALLNIVLSGLGYLYVGKREVFGSILLVSELLTYLWMYIDPSVQDMMSHPLVYVIGFLWMLALAIDGYNEAKMANASVPQTTQPPNQNRIQN